MAFLMIEEPFFSFNTCPISDEASISTDNSMTGNNDNDGIFIVCPTYGSDCFRISHNCSFFFVASCFSVRDFFESIPGFFLEFRSTWIEGDREFFTYSGKEFAEFFFCLDDYSVFTSKIVRITIMGVIESEFTEM